MLCEEKTEIGREKQAACETAPHRCLRSQGLEGRERVSTVVSLAAKELFPGHSPASWQGSEGGPEEGKAEGGTSEQEPCETSGEGKWG